MPRAITELAIVIVCIVLLGSYHLMLLRKLRRSPTATAMGRQRRTLACWLELNGAESRELVAVQALRNLIMSATFFGSTAVLLAVGILGAVFATENHFTTVHSLNVLGVQTESLWLLKGLLLAGVFLGAFFNLSLAIRSLNHLTFLLPCHWRGEIPSEEAAREMDRATLRYALGVRGYYLSIPLVLWFFGPLWMLTGTVLLVITLRRVD